MGSAWTKQYNSNPRLILLISPMACIILESQDQNDRQLDIDPSVCAYISHEIGCYRKKSKEEAKQNLPLDDCMCTM